MTKDKHQLNSELGIEDFSQGPPNPFGMFEQVLSFHQQLLRGGIVSDEILRIGVRTLRRQFDYASSLGNNFATMGNASSDFLQKITAASAADWQRTSELAATWTKETSQHAKH
jgi:hypothetical protein